MVKSVIDVYSDIAKSNPTWSAEEERAFIDSCTTKTGKWRSNAMKDRFVNEAMKHNLGLVFKIVGKLAFNKNEDVFQKAVISMVEALKKYDPKRKGKISTWITNPIRWAIMQHQNTYAKSGLIADELSAINHRYKTHFSVVSINQTIDGEGKDTLSSIISMNNVSPDFISARNIKTQHDIAHESDLQNGVHDLMNKLAKVLSEKEMIVINRAFNGKTQTEISIELKLSRMRISQLMASAFKKIRNSSVGRHLKEYIK